MSRNLRPTAPRQRAVRNDRDHAAYALFAEALAEGAAPSKAAVAAGKKPDAGAQMLKTIRRDLGEQAQ